MTRTFLPALLLGATAMALLTLVPAPEADSPEPGIVASVRWAGPWAHAGVALGVAGLVAAGAGALARWPYAPSLVRAIGHAALAAGLAGAAGGFRAALETAARIGPAATPADMAGGTDAALTCMIVGLLVETIALACAGALRLLPSPDPIPS